MSDAKLPLIAELEQAFQVINEVLFEGKLKPVPIVVQTKRKVSLRWSPDSESIIIGSDFPKLEYAEIPGVFLHELIHVANHQRGVVDVTTNQYHNKHFLECALQVGLVVIKHKTQGWAITSTVFPRNVVERVFIKRPNKDAVTRRDTAFGKLNIDKAAYRGGRAEVRERIKQEKPPKTYFLKYQCNCPPPHNSIRSGRRPDGPNALNIQCLNCRSQFECVTDLEE